VKRIHADQAAGREIAAVPFQQHSIVLSYHDGQEEKQEGAIAIVAT